MMGKSAKSMEVIQTSQNLSGLLQKGHPADRGEYRQAAGAYQEGPRSAYIR
jgi:hypothetical protein